MKSQRLRPAAQRYPTTTFSGELTMMKMKTGLIVLALYCLCSTSGATENLAIAAGTEMETAIVYSMHKVPCSTMPMTSYPPYQPGMEGQPVPVDADSPCSEYELRTARVSYVIRPRRDVLLLLAHEVQIRFVKGTLLLRSSELPKEIHCDVVSMTLLAPHGERSRESTTDTAYEP